jgi:cell division ATPase FtsA
MNGLNKGGSEGGGLGGLGGLMSGLSGLMGGGGGASGGENPLGGLGNLMGGITDMFSNPEFTNAMSQLSQQFTPSTSTENTENAETAENTDTTGNTEEQSDTTNSQGASAPPLFNNPLFSDLAKEIGNTFNFEEMEKEGKPQNIGEALSRFMSGNNPAKLMELVGKFGGKLQDEVKKGNINPADLLKQTMSAAGGGAQNMMNNPQMQNMMNNPQMQNKMNQMKNQNATRDRLRAKLEKKKTEKQD